jgi:uncharacterized protein
MGIRKVFHNGRELRSGWRLLIFIILFIGLGRGLRFLLEHANLPDYHGLNAMDLIISEGGTLLVSMIATAIMAYFEKRSLSVYGIPRLRDLFGRLFWVGLVWGALMPSAIILLIFLSGGYRVHGLNLQGAEMLKFASLWLFANLLIGMSEEITYRGYFLYTLSDGIGFWAAALFNAIGFGALHYFFKPFERWEDWVAVSLITIFITLAQRRTGSLAFSIGMHAAFDFMFIYVYSGRNGGDFAVGHLLNAEFPGSIRITGGMLGPEASWFCFVVTIVAIVLLNRTYRQAKWPLLNED